MFQIGRGYRSKLAEGPFQIQATIVCTTIPTLTIKAIHLHSVKCSYHLGCCNCPRSDLTPAFLLLVQWLSGSFFRLSLYPLDDWTLFSWFHPHCWRIWFAQILLVLLMPEHEQETSHHLAFGPQDPRLSTAHGRDTQERHQVGGIFPSNSLRYFSYYQCYLNILSFNLLYF